MQLMRCRTKKNWREDGDLHGREENNKQKGKWVTKGRERDRSEKWEVMMLSIMHQVNVTGGPYLVHGP